MPTPTPLDARRAQVLAQIVARIHGTAQERARLRAVAAPLVYSTRTL